jgi:hypothetical protein
MMIKRQTDCSPLALACILYGIMLSAECGRQIQYSKAVRRLRPIG